MQAIRAAKQATTPDLRVDPALGVVRRRIPELAVGVLLVGLGAIAVLVLTSADDTPTEVVVLAADVSRGDLIKPDDLSSVGITANAPVAVVAAESADALIGMVATTDLAAGSFLTDAHVAERSSVPRGFVLLGMRLTAGAYPSSQLRAGGRVDVLELPAEDPTSDPDAEETASAAHLLVGSVEVTRAQPLGVDPGSDLFVSLLVPDAAAGAVAAAVGSGRVWLGEVPA
jgi:hypothetical protein